MKNNFDINIYGHLVKDTIIFNDKITHKLGGIANVWDALLTLNSKLNIRLTPTVIGEAIIYVEDGQKFVKPHLNLLPKQNIEIVRAKWNHIAYVNNLPDTSFIRKLSKDSVISYDVSEGKEIDLELLKYCDYLFISYDETKYNIYSLGNLVKKWVIFHNKSFIWASDGHQFLEWPVPPPWVIEDVNVLGSGDMLAGSMINNLLKCRGIVDCMTQASKDVRDMLLKRKNNEKI